MTTTETKLPEQNMVLFDWLTFTSHCDSPESVMDLLGLVDVPWQVMDKGRNGRGSRDHSRPW